MGAAPTPSPKPGGPRLGHASRTTRYAAPPRVSASPLSAPALFSCAQILFATEEIGHVIEEPFGAGFAQEQFPPLSPNRIKEVFDFMDEDKSGQARALHRVGGPQTRRRAVCDCKRCVHPFSLRLTYLSL